MPSFSFFISLFAWILSSPGLVYCQQQQDPEPRYNWTDGRSFVTPPSDLFGGRLGCSITVLDDYLIINGGSIIWNRGNYTQPKWDTQDNNKTLALSLEGSWPSYSSIYEIIDKPKEFLHLDGSSLWADQKAIPQKIYSWGGYKIPAMGKSPDMPALRVFTRSAKESKTFTGTWTIESQPPKDDSSSSPILPTHYGSSTTCNDVGIMFGGRFESGETTTLITYNMTTNKWANHSAKAFGKGIKDPESKVGITVPGTYLEGAAVCLPTMGTDQGGLVFFLGGTQTSADPKIRGRVNMPMTTVYFYDILTHTFHEQITTGGEFPSVRTSPCLVATQARSDGLHNSYEIYMFGGHDEGHLVSADVWVLTVPGFRWFKARDVEQYNARVEHDCAVIGPGKRYMVSVGGRNGDSNIKGKDYWSGGIGIYDMTNLTWSSSLELYGQPYEKPSVVKDWYAARNLDSVVFGTRETAKIFGLESQFRGGDPGSPPSPSATPNPTPETQLPIGAIAGGVVGGVLLLVSAVCATLFIRRRRRRRRSNQVEQDNKGKSNNETPEASDKPLLDSTLVHELAPGTKTHEVSHEDNAVHEMPGGRAAAGELQDRDIAVEMYHDSRPQELPGSPVGIAGR